MQEEQRFHSQCDAEINALGADGSMRELSQRWLARAQALKYSYHFSWLGLPIFQYPQDVLAMQEVIWRVRPDVIIETGVARGGSLIFSASMLALLDMCETTRAEDLESVRHPRRRVIGIDIDIREHNRQAIEAHPLSQYITLIQGSSVDKTVVEKVAAFAQNANSVLVCLDSNHTHEHVLAELNAYAGMTTVGSYCVIFDTVIEYLPPDLIGDRPWSRGDSPMTAVREYLRSHPEFEVDKQIDNKLVISVAPDGYLKRVC